MLKKLEFTDEKISQIIDMNILRKTLQNPNFDESNPATLPIALNVEAKLPEIPDDIMYSIKIIFPSSKDLPMTLSPKVISYFLPSTS